MTLVLYLSLYVGNSCLVRGAPLDHAKNQPDGTLGGSTMNQHPPPTAQSDFRGSGFTFSQKTEYYLFWKKGGNWGPEILDGMHKAPPYAGPTATV